MFGFDSEIGSCIVLHDNANALKEDDSSDLFKYDIEKRCQSFIKYVEDKSKLIIDDYYEYIEQLAQVLLDKKRLYLKDITEVLGENLKKKGIIC